MFAGAATVSQQTNKQLRKLKPEFVNAVFSFTPMRTSDQAAGSQPEPSWSAVGKSGQARKKLVE